MLSYSAVGAYYLKIHYEILFHAFIAHNVMFLLIFKHAFVVCY